MSLFHCTNRGRFTKKPTPWDKIRHTWFFPHTTHVLCMYGVCFFATSKIYDSRRWGLIALVDLFLKECYKNVLKMMMYNTLLHVRIVAYVSVNVLSTLQFLIKAESSSSWCSLSTKLLMARLPTIFLNCFKFTLHQRVFDQVLCFSSLNPSLDTHGVTGLFLQPRHAYGTLYHLIFDLVSVLQNSSLFSKLILCHRFSMTNFFVSVFLCVMFCFCFVFVLFLVLLRLELPAGWICAHYKSYYYYYYYLLLRS